MPDILTSAGALALLAALFWPGYLCAHAGLPHARPSLRLAAAVGAALAFAIVAFHLLALTALFSRAVAIPLFVVAAGIAHWKGAGQPALAAFRRDVAAGCQRVRALLYSPAGAALAAVALVIVFRLLKGLAAPPVAWDALTYHLVRPALWIQNGTDFRPHWPDAFEYLAQLPVAGDVLWAWAMLPMHGDDFLSIAGLLLIAGSLLGTYAASVSLGAKESDATLAGAAVVLLPAVMNLFATAYVDNLSVVSMVVGLALLAEHAVRPTRGSAVLAIASLAVGAATKVHMVAPLVMGLALVAWHARRDPVERVRQPLLAALVALPICAGYLRTYLATGSPFYPMYLSFRGQALLPYSDEYRLISDGPGVVPGVFATLSRIVFDGFLAFTDGDPQGLGPLVPLVLVAGLLSMLRMLRRDRARRPVLLCLLATALLFFFALFSDQMRGQRWWGANISRYLTPAVAALFCCAARLPHPAVRALFLFGAIIGIGLTVPRHIAAAEQAAMIELATVLGLCGAGTAALCWLVRRKARALMPWLYVLGLWTAAALIPPLRARHRHAIYAAVTRQPPYNDLHSISRQFADANTIWNLLDAGKPHRIAVAANYVWPGHNVLRYPLFGRRLQNRLLYVPISRSGAVVSNRFAETLESDPPDQAAWLVRLYEAEVDILVSLEPASIERRWAEEHPFLFRVIHRSESGNTAYAINLRAMSHVR